MADAFDPLIPDENLGPALIAVSTVLIALVIVTTSIRALIRINHRNVGYDDYTIVFSAFLAVTRWVVQVVQVSRHDNGRHRQYVSNHDYEKNNMLGWYAQMCLFGGICALKVSIMLLILRMKDTRALKIAMYAAIVGLVVTNFGVIIILLAECRPIGYWSRGAKCWNPKVRIYAIYFTIAYSIVTDFICSLLPLVVIWKVRIPTKTKIMVCALMSSGLLATAFGIVRASSLGLVTNDLTWSYALAAIWSNLEFYMGLILANLALSRQAYRYFYPPSPTNDNSSNNVYAYPRSGATDNSRGHDRFSRKLRDPVGDLGLVEQDTYVVSASRGRSSITRSEGSDIPLEPGVGIRKKTEFWMSNEVEDERDVADEGRGREAQQGNRGA